MSRAHLPYHNNVRAKHRIYIRGHAATQLSISGQRQWNDREWVPLRNQQSQFPIFTTLGTLRSKRLIIPAHFKNRVSAHQG